MSLKMVNAIQEFMGLSFMGCHYTMLRKYGKCTCDFWGHLITFILVFYILETFLIEQLSHLYFLDTR